MTRPTPLRRSSLDPARERKSSYTLRYQWFAYDMMTVSRKRSLRAWTDREAIDQALATVRSESFEWEREMRYELTRNRAGHRTIIDSGRISFAEALRYKEAGNRKRES